MSKADFFSERRVTARKTHRCEECGREIKPGDSYVKSAGCYDNEFYAFKECSRCSRVRAKILLRYPVEYWGEGPVLGGLLEYVRESRRQ